MAVSWSYQQSSFLMMNITLLAQSMGIYSIIMGGYDDEKLKEAFKIPKRFQISAVMALGYPVNLESKMPTLRHPLGRNWVGFVRSREDFVWRPLECFHVITFCFTRLIKMRGGKRGSHKGRERILVENEEDIIARNMMVCRFHEVSVVGGS